MLRALKQWILGKATELPLPYFLVFANLAFRYKSQSTRVACSSTGDLYVEENGRRLAIAIKHRFSRYLNGLGHTLNSLAHAYSLDTISLNPGDVVIDCGANVGELAAWLEHNRPGVIYVGFEPAPREFQALQKNLPADGMAVDKGLWHVTGKLDFYLASQTADSSAFQTSVSTEVISINVVRLDEWLARGKKIKVLKVEAEGAEPEVLLGAEKVLDQCEFVVVDSSAERGINNIETTTQIVNFLVPKGFELLSISHRSRVICVFQKNS